MANYLEPCAEKEVVNHSENGSGDGLLDSDDITIIERIKICFKPKYQMKKLKTKGAILVLVLNFL